MPGSTAIIFPSEDGYKRLFTDEICDYCNFYILPVSYTIDSVAFYDGLNTDNEIFFNPNFTDSDFKYIGIPEQVFTRKLEEIERDGFSSALILTPSRRLPEIYKTAFSAVQKYRRRKCCVEGRFRAEAADTQSFSTGVGITAVRCAQFMRGDVTMDEIMDHTRQLSARAVTLVYKTSPDDMHSFLNGSVCSFDNTIRSIRIFSNRITPLKSKPGDDAGIEKFMRDCARNLREDSVYTLAADPDYLGKAERAAVQTFGFEPILSAPLSATDSYCFSANSIIISIL